MLDIEFIIIQYLLRKIYYIIKYFNTQQNPLKFEMISL